MTLFKLWYIGMTLVVIIQQITIWYLIRKLEEEKENNKPITLNIVGDK